MIRGVLIPGLAMASEELPLLEGFVRLENPEVGDALTFPGDYDLADVARAHLASIEKLRPDPNQTFHIVGMSMGGMIASILATLLRKSLPAKTQFRFLVTSPNLEELPAVSEKLLEAWCAVRPGSVEGFSGAMAHFFSKDFRAKNPAKVQSYCEYRASGRNRQSSRSFIRQVFALRNFDGRPYFSGIDPGEATFIGGADDSILGPPHNAALARLCPEARHVEVPRLGHMVNLERPELFDPDYPPAAGILQSTRI